MKNKLDAASCDKNDWYVDFLSRVGFLPSCGFQDFVNCSDTSRYDLQELWEMFLEQTFEDVEILTEEDCKKYGMDNELTQYLIQILNDTDFAGHFTICELVKRLAAFSKEQFVDTSSESLSRKNGESVSITTVQYLSQMDNKKQVIKSILEKLSLLCLKENQKNSQVWFHGTTWEYAQSIIQDGIRTTKGKEYHDFGREPAFYMTSDLEVAIKKAFSHQIKEKQQALVVFIFKKGILEIMEKRKDNIMDLTNDDEKWKEVILHSRCRKLSKETVPEHIDAVIGPYATKPEISNYSNYKKNSIQLALPERFRNGCKDGGLVFYINNDVNMQVFKLVPK